MRTWLGQLNSAVDRYHQTSRHHLYLPMLSVMLYHVGSTCSLRTALSAGTAGRHMRFSGSSTYCCSVQADTQVCSEFWSISLFGSNFSLVSCISQLRLLRCCLCVKSLTAGCVDCPWQLTLSVLGLDRAGRAVMVKGKTCGGG